MLKYGIVSCASIIDRFIHAVETNGDIVVAIASRDITKAQQKATQHHIEKAYGSYEEMYQDHEIDIVYIANNNANHVEEIKKALHYRKHVICEKPIALNKEDAIHIFTYAKQQKCFLMEAQKSVFLPATLKVKEIFENKILGDLHQVEMSSSFPNPSASWMHDEKQGGVIYGSASYTLEYLDYIMKPEKTGVSAMGIREDNGTCERVSMNIRMDDVLINSRISMHGDTLHHALFYFERGYIEIASYWKARECIVHYQDRKEVFSYPCDYEMIYEVKHIRECIEKGLLESPIMSAKRSITCCAYVDEIISQIHGQYASNQYSSLKDNKINNTEPNR